MLFIAYASIREVEKDNRLELEFSEFHCQKDQQSIIIKCNVLNSGELDITISDQYFLLCDFNKQWLPNISYMSEQHVPLKLWSWKTLKPKQQCTLLLRYNHLPKIETLQFKFHYQQVYYFIQNVNNV